MSLQKSRYGKEDDNWVIGNTLDFSRGCLSVLSTKIAASVVIAVLGFGVILFLLPFSMRLFLLLWVIWKHLAVFDKIVNLQKVRFGIGDGIWVMGKTFGLSSG